MTATTGSTHTPFYAPHATEIRKRLKPFLDEAELTELKKRRAWRHFMMAGRHIAVTVVCAVICFQFTNPWIWIPAAILQGVNILGYIVLLHDAIHHAIFQKTRKRWSYAFAFLYSLPSSIAASQFERWHLDHHAELGSEHEDPKRAYLTPKIVTRLFKLLYMTPALFVIYSMASRKAAARYPAALKRKIAIEKVIGTGAQVALLVWLWSTFGFETAARVHIVPLFLFFPIAFTINRLGQHYDVDPSDPAKWGTVIPGGPLINFFFLNSNFHLEHHYFPRVPLYNLPRLHRMLVPFWASIDHRPRTYREVLWGWFVLNRAPHTNWEDFVQP